jgi:hypothetical protein
MNLNFLPKRNLKKSFHKRFNFHENDFKLKDATMKLKQLDIIFNWDNYTLSMNFTDGNQMYENVSIDNLKPTFKNERLKLFLSGLFNCDLRITTRTEMLYLGRIEDIRAHFYHSNNIWLKLKNIDDLIKLTSIIKIEKLPVQEILFN